MTERIEDIVVILVRKIVDNASENMNNKIND